MSILSKAFAGLLIWGLLAWVFMQGLIKAIVCIAYLSLYFGVFIIVILMLAGITVGMNPPGND